MPPEDPESFEGPVPSGELVPSDEPESELLEKFVPVEESIPLIGGLPWKSPLLYDRPLHWEAPPMPLPLLTAIDENIDDKDETTEENVQPEAVDVVVMLVTVDVVVVLVPVPVHPP